MRLKFKCTNETIQTHEMQIGDVVRPVTSKSPWDTCIVKNRNDDTITLWRPYGHRGDISYHGLGVICYTGLEVYKIPLSHSALRNDYWIRFEKATEV